MEKTGFQMKPTNKAAIKALEDSPYILSARSAVSTLIRAGFLEADPVTEPERFAEAAKVWCSNASKTGPKEVFACAAGWTTAGWEAVMRQPLFYPATNQNVFKALVILAKEAGIEL